MTYADPTWYRDEWHGELGTAEVAPLLEEASAAIDAVTFCRIVAVGWDRLTEFQQDRVRRACCVQADFLHENADAVRSALTSYSINGVSMEFGNAALYEVVGGTPVANAAMALLRQTGLASLMAYPQEVRP